MIERPIRVRNLSPVLIRANRSRTQFAEGLSYLPGSTFRGAVAAHYLQSQGEDDDFDAIFEQGQVSFGDLLPATEDEPSRRLPTTASLCKRYGWDHTESLTDALLRLALADLLQDAAPLEDAAWAQCPHPDCRGTGNPRDRIGGAVYCTPTYTHVPVYRRLRAGTSIDRATGTTYTGMLFSHQVLEENQFFWGTLRIYGEDAAAEALGARLQAVVPTNQHLHVGSARSRGLGRVELTWNAATPPHTSLENRWDFLNRAVATLWATYGQTPRAPYFTLTLESDTLLEISGHRPLTASRDPAEVPRALGLQGVTLCRHAIVPATVGGWDARRGLPKPDVPAMGSGSVFLLRLDEGDPAQMQSQLAWLEREGIGRRRGEGYGRVRVCDPFHYDL